ncbi:hypothetical protein CRG98_045655, partial [Punica granatum]
MTVMTPAPADQQEDVEMLVPQSDVAVENNDQPQSMEVAAPAEAASTADNQVTEDPQPSRFTWRIGNFSRINSKRIYSEPFVVGGYR